MPSQVRRPDTSSGRNTARLCLVAAAGLAAGLAVAPPSVAEPPGGLDDVRDRVGELHEDASEANERFHSASEQLADINRRLEQAAARVQRQEERLARLTADVGGFAAATYRAGGVEPAVHALLATDPVEFLARASVIDAFASQQAEQLEVVAAERQRLITNQLVLEEERERQRALEAERAQQKESVDHLLAKQERLLARLSDDQRTQLQQQRRRDREVASAERERALKQLSRGAGPSSADSLLGALPRAVTAVEAALTKLGSAYDYGGKGPSTFDCSGFTRWAWSQAGVSLSSSSRSQFSQGRQVPADELQPGDLLFYDSPVSHVAMYIGAGQVVHASNPRTDVTIAPAMEAGGPGKSFVGATRPA